MDQRFIAQLIDVSTLIQREKTLEDGLRDLAQMTARSLGARRCSVMLLAEDDGERRLKVCSHFGHLSSDAYAQSVPLDAGVAGYVASTGEPLLVADIARSRFANIARGDAIRNPSLMAAPIKVADVVVGVINISEPSEDVAFHEAQMDLLKVLALFVGKSIHVFELQKLAESRVLQMAEVLRQRESDDHEKKTICPDPARLAKMVAKNIYRELSAAGFGPNAIIAVSSQVLSELSDNLKRHQSRLAKRNG
jgi:L-methionine (R)-S-oxide reductase